MRTADAARGKWAGILCHMGIDENYLRDTHGPCPICGGKDRFRFDDKGGDGTFFCNSCGAGNGFDLAMRYTEKSFKEVANDIDKIANNIRSFQVRAKDKKDPLIRLRRIQGGLKPVTNQDPVFRYLASRGLSPSYGLFHHPSLEYYENGILIGRFPSMVAALRMPDGSPQSYHVTYLTSDGRKAPVASPKKIMPPVTSLDGSCVRLSEVDEEIGIAEGIESALAVKSRFGVNCWSACNENLLQKFEPPEKVKFVRIFGDNDQNYVGQSAAFALARKLSKRGIKVEVNIPGIDGFDFADMLAMKLAKKEAVLK